MQSFISAHPEYFIVVLLSIFLVIRFIILVARQRPDDDDSDDGGGWDTFEPELDLPPGVGLPMDDQPARRTELQD